MVLVVLFVWGRGFYVSTFFPPPKIPKPFQPTLNPPKLKASHPSSGLKVAVVVGLVGLVVVVVGFVGLVVVVVGFVGLVVVVVVWWGWWWWWCWWCLWWWWVSWWWWVCGWWV